MKPLLIVHLTTAFLRAFLDYREHIVLVEGKRDVAALESLGFSRVYALHQVSVPLRERIRQLLEQFEPGARISVLTDFDRRGTLLHGVAISTLKELGARIDTRLRILVRGSGISHVEGLDTFVKAYSL